MAAGPVPRMLISTVLFTDLEGFTTLWRKNWIPQALIDWLNTYLDADD